MESYSVPIGLKPMWKCGNNLQTGTQVEWGDKKIGKQNEPSVAQGRKRQGACKLCFDAAHP